MKLTKVVDLDKYEDNGYGIESDCTYRFFISQMANSVRVLLFFLWTKVHQRIMLIEKTLHKKMKFSINDFFSKCELTADLVTFTEKSLMENFIFCAVKEVPDHRKGTTYEMDDTTIGISRH